MLNPTLNAAALNREFQRAQRLSIPAILESNSAETLSNCLRRDVPWGVATMVDGQNHNYQAQELQAMAPAEWQAIVARVQADARTGYQFMFNNYQMVTAYKEKRDPGLFLHRLLEYLNSPPLLEFVRQVTGLHDIGKADAQATRYLPGHFLRRHNDLLQYSDTDSRRAAYVLNMTTNWQPDWGGQLQFMDEDGTRVEESWLPGWNALSLFKVPVWHCVSCVAPFATEPRLAITGWFRTH